MELNRRRFAKLAAASAASSALPNLGLASNGSYPAGFQDVHNSLISIDGAVPLIAGTLDPSHFDMWIEGGVTAISLTVGGANFEHEVTIKLMSWIAEQVQTRPELMLCRTAHDIRVAKANNRLGIFYHFQGPSALGIDLDRVWYYKQMGVGVMQFAYNTRNPYANGITERVDGGLSLLGLKLVDACNQARMIVDVSHTGAQSSLDAIEASAEPVIMSHANARGQLDSPRNVPDHVLKAIAASGGFVGAVAYPAFVSQKPQPTMDDMVAMIDYLVELLGVDHVAMGLDYDSTTHGVLPPEQVEAAYRMMVDSGSWDPSAYPPPPYKYPEGMELPNKLANLTGALMARGYTNEDLAKIWGGNWLRVMEQVWDDPTAQVIHDEEAPFHHH